MDYSFSSWLSGGSERVNDRPAHPKLARTIEVATRSGKEEDVGIVKIRYISAKQDRCHKEAILRMGLLLH